MAKKKTGPIPTIDRHPKREQIRTALINGTPRQEIKRKYGIPIATQQRYLKDHLAEEYARAMIKRDNMDQELVFDLVKENLDDLRIFAAALREELRDPEDPEKYFLGPRAGEVEVLYLYKDPKDKSDTPPSKGKASLQDLLNKIGKNGYNAAATDVKYADPRELHIKNTNALTKAIDSLARILGMVKEIKINVVQTEEWTIIKQAVIQATKEAPEVKRKIVESLKRVDPGL